MKPYASVLLLLLGLFYWNPLFLKAQDKKTVSFSIAPFSLLHRNLKMDLEFRFKNNRQSILVNPNYFFGYHNEDIPYLWNRIEVNHLSGVGVELMHKVYFFRLKDESSLYSWRLYGAYGGGLQNYTVDYNAYSYFPIEEDGIFLYTYDNVKNKDVIMRYSGSIETGLQKRTGRFLFEVSGGLKYQWANTHHQYFNHRNFGDNFTDVGYSGWIPRAGIKIGFLLF